MAEAEASATDLLVSQSISAKKAGFSCFNQSEARERARARAAGVKISFVDVPYYFAFLRSANQRLPSVCNPISVDLGTPELRVNDLEKGQSELS